MVGVYLSNILADKKDSTQHRPSIYSLDIAPQDAPDALTNQEVGFFHMRDPYRYLWFRVLIALYFLLILECVLLVLLIGSILPTHNQNVTAIFFSRAFRFWVWWVFICLEAYAMAFVLCEIHGDWLTDGLTRSHLPRSFQRNCGLTTPFIAMLCVLAITGV